MEVINLNKKGILKMMSNGKERMMHYLLEDDKIMVLSLEDTELINEIKNNSKISVTFDLKKGGYSPGEVNIICDKAKIKVLFNRMLTEKMTYFKVFDERLIILEINLK